MLLHHVRASASAFSGFVPQSCIFVFIGVVFRLLLFAIAVVGYYLSVVVATIVVIIEVADFNYLEHFKHLSFAICVISICVVLISVI